MIHFQHHTKNRCRNSLAERNNTNSEISSRSSGKLCRQGWKIYISKLSNIADITGYSRITIIRTIKQLCALHLITKRQERLSTSNNYEINLELVASGGIIEIPEVLTVSHQASDPMTLEVLNLESNEDVHKPVDNCSIPSVPSITVIPELVSQCHQTGITVIPNQDQLTKPLSNNSEVETKRKPQRTLSAPTSGEQERKENKKERLKRYRIRTALRPLSRSLKLLRIRIEPPSKLLVRW